jgi:hypothetical protein
MDALIRGIIIDVGTNRNLRCGVVERWNRVAIGLYGGVRTGPARMRAFCDVLAKLENVPTWRPINGVEKPESSVGHGRAILAAVTNRINRTVTPISDMPGP